MSTTLSIGSHRLDGVPRKIAEQLIELGGSRAENVLLAALGTEGRRPIVLLVIGLEVLIADGHTVRRAPVSEIRKVLTLPRGRGLEGRSKPVGFVQMRDGTAVNVVRGSHGPDELLRLLRSLVPAANMRVSSAPVVVLTVDAVPERRISAVLGVVHGFCATSRDLVPQAGFDLKQALVGNLRGIETAFRSGMNGAMADLTAQATSLGADAVVGVQASAQIVTAKAQVVMLTGTAVRLAAGDTTG